MLLGEAPAGVYAMARQLRTPIRQARQAFDSLLTPIVARDPVGRRAASTASAIATATRLILAVQLALRAHPGDAWAAAARLVRAGIRRGYLAALLLAAAETIQGAFSVSDLLLLYLRARLALAVTVAMIAVTWRPRSR